jgi:hypothetical protein
MSIYAQQGTQTIVSRSALILISTAAIRPRLIEYALSTTGTPGSDASYEVQVQRITTVGTSTSVTPQSTDPNDPAATLIAGSNSTAEGTPSGVPLDDRGVNPRASYRWVPYDQRAELIMPATASNGLRFFVATLGGAITVIADAKVLQ